MDSNSTFKSRSSYHITTYSIRIPKWCLPRPPGTQVSSSRLIKSPKNDPKMTKNQKGPHLKSGLPPFVDLARL